MAADLDTPAVTILLDRLENNIARVQRMVSDAGRANRPHIKTHKIPAIGRMQIEAGAVGLTCQKLGEAEIFIDAGVTDDLLITFNIVGAAKTGRLMDLSERIKRLAVVADNEAVLRGISEAARSRGRDVPVLIECDSGFGRNGVQSPEAALDLARLAGTAARPGVRGAAGLSEHGAAHEGILHPRDRRCSRRRASRCRCCRAAARRRC